MWYVIIGAVMIIVRASGKLDLTWWRANMSERLVVVGLFLVACGCYFIWKRRRSGD